MKKIALFCLFSLLLLSCKEKKDKVDIDLEDYNHPKVQPGMDTTARDSFSSDTLVVDSTAVDSAKTAVDSASN